MSPPEIVVVPFPHPGHLFPVTELCNQLASRNCHVTVFYPSSSTPSSLSLHPLIRIVEFSLGDSVNFKPPALDETILNLIAVYFKDRDSSDFPVCAIVDEMISWAIDPFLELQVPAVTFFTSSACSSALSHAMDQMISTDELLTPGTIMTVPGLPEEMALASSSLAARPGPPNIGRGPPHANGKRPKRGLAASEDVAAMLFNTCCDLERPFLDYVAREAKKPVWGVGPLLPVQFKDGEVRSKRESSVTEEQVIQWLDSKPRGSVIYVSFGSLVNPSDEELAELAAGLEESNRPFIWVVQPNSRRHDSTGRPIEGESRPAYSPVDTAKRVGSRGLIIKGWAPQLTILSHPTTGGYVCHCGWNSTVEALRCGVPMLTWPVRGDQHHNARLVTGLLRVGLALKEGDVAVTKEDVVRGIEMLMGDEGIKERAAEMKGILKRGFPKSSADSVDDFLSFISKK